MNINFEQTCDDTLTTHKDWGEGLLNIKDSILFIFYKYGFIIYQYFKESYREEQWLKENP